MQSHDFRHNAHLPCSPLHKQLTGETDKLKLRITLFVLLAGLLMMYIAYGLLKMQAH